jgi:hypothetical protein
VKKLPRFFFLSACALMYALPVNAADAKAQPADAPTKPVAIDKLSIVFAAEAHVTSTQAASKRVLAAVISTDFNNEPNQAKAVQLLEKNAAEAAKRIDEAKRTKTWMVAVSATQGMGEYNSEKNGFHTGIDQNISMLYYPVKGATNITYGVRFSDPESFALIPMPAETAEKFAKAIQEKKAHLLCEVEGTVASVQLERGLNKLSPSTPTKMLQLTVQKVTLKFDDGTVIGSMLAPVPAAEPAPAAH